MLPRICCGSSCGRRGTDGRCLAGGRATIANSLGPAKRLRRARPYGRSTGASTTQRPPNAGWPTCWVASQRSPRHNLRPVDGFHGRSPPHTPHGLPRLRAPRLEPRGRALVVLHRRLDTWAGIGTIAMGMARQGPPAHAVRCARLAGDVLRDGGRWSDEYPQARSTMPLITCPECSNQVSDQAAADVCPSCGQPIKRGVPRPRRAMNRLGPQMQKLHPASRVDVCRHFCTEK